MTSAFTIIHSKFTIHLFHTISSNCGTTVITDRKDTIQNLTSHGLHLDNNIQNPLFVPFNKPEVAAQNILSYFGKKYKERERNLFSKESNYESYIFGNEKVISMNI